MKKTTAKKTAKGTATVAGDFGRADVFEWRLPPAVLDVLLKDRTTGRNIVWGTRDYERAFGAGTGFGENDEVFTSSWVCNAQNNLVDAAWFRAKSAPFNVRPQVRIALLRGVSEI